MVLTCCVGSRSREVREHQWVGSLEQFRGQPEQGRGAGSWVPLSTRSGKGPTGMDAQDLGTDVEFPCAGDQTQCKDRRSQHVFPP